MSTPIETRTARVRGGLEMRPAGLFLGGYCVEEIDLTAHPSLLALRTQEEAEQPNYVSSGDFLYVLTGLERVEEEQVQAWHSAFLLARHHLSEIMEIYEHAPGGRQQHRACPHPVCLALFCVENTRPFHEAIAQAREFLCYLSHFPVLLTEQAHLFAACLIAVARLEAILESVEQGQLEPIIERVIDGKSFQGAISRAQQTLVHVFSLVFGEEPMHTETRQSPPQQPRRNLTASSAISLLAVLALCARWWLLRRGVKVIPEVRWYDLWTGLYIRPHKPGETTLHLYWCPVWCIAVHVEWPL